MSTIEMDMAINKLRLVSGVLIPSPEVYDALINVIESWQKYKKSIPNTCSIKIDGVWYTFDDIREMVKKND
jgi:hypothetical protein